MFTNPNFTDERGTITDLMVTPECSVTHITFTPGAVRGNHYHEHTKQIDIVLKGQLECHNGKTKQILFDKHVIQHEPKTPHAYKAIESSEILSICFGPRKGEDYEKDVIRLETPLL